MRAAPAGKAEMNEAGEGELNRQGKAEMNEVAGRDKRASEGE